MVDGVDDPVPVVVFCELPVLVPEVVEPSDVVAPGCVVELGAAGDCALPGVVDVVEGTVEVVVAGEPSAGFWSVVAEPVGVAPPGPIIVAVPPVACDGSLAGAATVVVDVVTVFGMAGDGAVAVGAIRICGSGCGTAATGAACSGGPTLEYVTGAGTGATWRLAGATSAARA